MEVKADCSFAIHGKGFGGEKPMESGYPDFFHRHSFNENIALNHFREIIKKMFFSSTNKKLLLIKMF